MQGFELNALKHATNILPTVKAISVELEFCEAYEGQYQFEAVINWLDQQGFQLVAAVENESWFFGDGIFVRKSLL